MQRYEFVEGGSAKFWEAGVVDATLTVRFGRTGTQGQTKDKVFDTPAAAVKELAKLVREKTGKGYVLAGTAMEAPVKPVPIQAAAADVADEPAALPGPVQPNAVATEEGKLFHGEPLPTRTRPGPAVDPATAWLTLRSLFQKDVSKGGDERQTALGLLRACFDGPPPQSIDVERARTLLNATILAQREFTSPYDRRHSKVNQPYLLKFVMFAHWLVGQHGALFAMVVANKMRPALDARTSRNSVWSDPLALGLRAALAHAPNADYDAAVQFCLRCVDDEPELFLKAYYTLILADDRPLAAHGLRALPLLRDTETQGTGIEKAGSLAAFVVECPPSEVVPWLANAPYSIHFTQVDVSPTCAAATALATARIAGESPVPVLQWLMQIANDQARITIACAILETREDQAFASLLPLWTDKAVRAAVDLATKAYPDWMFQQCLTALASRTGDPALRARVMAAIGQHGEDAARSWAAALPAKPVSLLETLLAGRSVTLAPLDATPDVLRQAPWRTAHLAAVDLALAVAPIPTPFAYKSDDRNRDAGLYTRDAGVMNDLSDLGPLIEAVENGKIPSWSSLVPPAEPLPGQNASDEHRLAWLMRRLEQIRWQARYAGVGSSGYRVLYRAVHLQPAPLLLALWERTDFFSLITNAVRVAQRIILDHREAALPGLLAVAGADPELGLTIALQVDAAAIAPIAARALQKLKKARAPALAWLTRYRRTSLLRLIPDAIGKPGPERDAAEYTLRWFAAATPGGSAAIATAADEYVATEPRIHTAVAQVLGRDPLLQYPAKIAKLPEWLVVPSLSRPVLRTGGALPDAAMAALVEMLSFSTPEDVYAGVPQVRDACTPDSLGRFVWSLFSAWLTAGGPARDGWAMRAVGWLGDDECARQLTRLIRRWPGESAHARAVGGLDVLADIGSDVALMNLNGIAEKLKFKGLQDRARDKIAALAEARGLTAEELADRLAPDLDLDERGGLDLDFGPRRFRAGFDEMLRPWVRDAAATRLKDLPKPNRSDDAELSAAAVVRWAALKKDARAVASQQLVRLETMLATARRVDPAVFQPFFATHPLIRSLAQRLVWGIYPDAGVMTPPTRTFRVTEDLAFTDDQDDPVDTPDQGLIGVVHPLQIGPDGFVSWGALFGDYEISQPFAQLGREVFRLTPAEAAGASICRFDGMVVESPRLRGLASRGWPLGPPQDGGVSGWIERAVRFGDGTEAEAHLGFENGLGTDGSYDDKTQTLRSIYLYARDPASGTRTFGDLDPLQASEMLRALAPLVAAAK